jgi:hypothetical protein
MQKRSQGFAFLKPADRLVEEYLSTPQAVRHRGFIDDLWARIRPHDPRAYRGIGCIVDGIPPPPDEDLDSWLATLNVDRSDPLLGTRLAIGRFFEDDLTNTNGYLLFDLEHVQHALQLVPASERIQVVRVRRESFSSGTSVLGFDVGYWGGDHYSIVCDSIVTPTWHPPQPEDFAALAEALATLNNYLLFPTPEEAAEFRTRYMHFAWAETEGYPGEFEVIQVEAVEARRPTRRCS